jgi:hypothetical protein
MLVKAVPAAELAKEKAEGDVSRILMFWHSSINIAEWLKSDLVLRQSSFED